MAFLSAFAASMAKWFLEKGYVALGKAIRKWQRKKKIDDTVDGPLEDYQKILREIKYLKRKGKKVSDELKKRKLEAARRLVRS